MEERVNLENAREKLAEGVKLLYDAVKLTLGPSGNTVVITDEEGFPHVTKDGATVSLAVSHEDPEVNCGIELVRQASVRTAKEAGDGTTTSAILAHGFIDVGMRLIRKGVPVRDILYSLDKVREKACGCLRKYAIPVGDDYGMIGDIASIAANNDRETGKMIEEAYRKTGMGVDILLEEGFDERTFISAVRGIRFGSGYESSVFVNNLEKHCFEASNCVVLMFENPVNLPGDITNVYNPVREENLLIIVPSFTGAVLDFMVAAVKSGYRMCLVRSEGWGDMQKEHIRDIAVMLDPDYEQSDVYLVRADKVYCDNLGTSVIGGKGDTSKYVGILRKRAEVCEVEEHRDALLRRADILENGTCSITVGAGNRSELKERMDRFEDAVCAARSAVKEGVLPGGGLALYRIMDDVYAAGCDDSVESSLWGVLEIPYEILVKEGGSGLRYKGEGDIFTAFRGDDEVNCFDMGILDACKVERVALENAISVAKLILSTGCIIRTS